MNAQFQTELKPSTPSSFTPVPRGLLQRKCACGGSAGLAGECEECRGKRLQRRSTNGAVPTSVPPIVEEVLHSPGQPLDRDTRTFMESRFAHDFSRVRVHSNAKATESAKAVNALAYTVGQDVVFGEGRYSPNILSGKRLLAHELTHVVQQAQGATGVSPVPRNESTDEHEAQLAANNVVTHQGALPAIGASAPALRLNGVPAAQPAPPQPRPQSGGLNLSELTTFRFNFGPAQFTVDLPSSLRMRLPVSLQGSRAIVFNLSAGTSGDFSFSITLDAIPHVRISARAGVDVGDRTASAGLRIETTRTVCRAQNPLAARAALQRAGEALRDAILNLQNAPPPAPGEAQAGNLSRMADVVSAIGGVHSAVEAAKAPCREVPLFELDFGARTPLERRPGALPGEEQESFLGGTATLRF